jgi:hypothetical protein
MVIVKFVEKLCGYRIFFFVVVYVSILHLYLKNDNGVCIPRFFLFELNAYSL